MNLSHISDELLKNEYTSRFGLKTGDTLIQNSQAAVDHLRQYFIDEPDRESFVVLFLNGRNQIIATDTLASGTISTASVFPREIVKAVLKHKSSAVILAHSHPSGNPEASRDDITITRKLRDALATIDVRIHDHLILSGNRDEFTSMADKGLL